MTLARQRVHRPLLIEYKRIDRRTTLKGVATKYISKHTQSNQDGSTQIVRVTIKRIGREGVVPVSIPRQENGDDTQTMEARVHQLRVTEEAIKNAYPRDLR